MRNSPSIVPDPDNRDIYLVLDDWYVEQDRVVPPNLEDFIDRHGGGRPVQLPLPLRGAA
jgi:hypothetical protein